MPLILIDPAEIQITGAKPKSIYGSQAYCIVQSCWDGYSYMNRYHRGWIGLEFDEVRDVVESQRVRGKNWAISSIPAAIVEYNTTRFAILPLNERNSAFYSRLLERISGFDFPFFWKHLPRKVHEWLLVFAIKGEVPQRVSFKPEWLRSVSHGGSCALDWEDCPAENKYLAFLTFSESLAKIADNHPGAL